MRRRKRRTTWAVLGAGVRIQEGHMAVLQEGGAVIGVRGGSLQTHSREGGAIPNSRPEAAASSMHQEAHEDLVAAEADLPPRDPQLQSRAMPAPPPSRAGPQNSLRSQTLRTVFRTRDPLPLRNSHSRSPRRRMQNHKSPALQV
jgi:hypothetical protein